MAWKKLGAVVIQKMMFLMITCV